MNIQTITLGDGTIVLITYDNNQGVLSITSTNPVFIYLVGSDFTLNIGPFISNTMKDIAYLMQVVYDNLKPKQ